MIYRVKKRKLILRMLISMLLLTSSIFAEEFISMEKSKWSTYGATYGVQLRTYNGKAFIYSTPRIKQLGGMYQSFATVVGTTYTVSAILIGTDTNRLERFNGASKITISDEFPNENGSNVIVESDSVTGGTEKMVSFTFTATTTTSYLALRSDAQWHYASARALSVKKIDASDREADENDNSTNEESVNNEEENRYDNSDELNNNSLEVIHLNKTLLITNNNTTLENKHFICDAQNFSAIQVSAKNTLIKGNLFKNCATGINLHNAYNTTITGNRFDNIGAGIIGTWKEEGSRIEYNEFVNMGILDCTVATGGGNCNIYGPRNTSRNGIFSHNLVDNRGANARYMEDYIGIYSGNNEFEQNMVVEDNLLIGSTVSSTSGSCFLADGRGSKYIFRGNKCYNVSGYGMAIASAKNALVEDNLIYMDEAHVKAITKFNTNQILDGSYAFAATDFYAGECASNIKFINNKGYTYFKYLGNIGYGWKCLGVDGGYLDLEGTYANNITLAGNQFLESDPHWEIPTNIFDGLDSRYFSGSGH